MGGVMSFLDYNGLAHFLDKMDQSVDEKINANKDQYLTSEHKIGYWIDGKPLYRRVYVWTGSFGMSTSRTTQVVGTVPANMDQPVYCHGYQHCVTPSAIQFIPFADAGINASLSFDIYVGNLSLIAKWNGAITVDKIVAILEYTKTTDRPSAVNAILNTTAVTASG